MTVFYFILLLLSFICFAVAATGWAHARWNLVALGLALWVLTLLVETGRAL